MTAQTGIIYLLVNSVKIASNTQLVIQYIQEGISSIRDIILQGSQDSYYRLFKEADFYKKSMAPYNDFLGVFPRYAIEGIAIFLVAILSGIFSSSPASSVGRALDS